MRPSLDVVLAEVEKRFPTREEMNVRFDAVPTREEMNARFDEVPTRAEMHAGLEEVKRHSLVLFERRDDDIRQLAEGILALDERLTRVEVDLRATMNEGFSRLESLIRTAFVQVGQLQGRLGGTGAHE